MKTSLFQTQKEIAMKRLQEAGEKAEVDLGILPILDYINSLRDFYTTSSCSGRITLFHDLGSKLKSDWLDRWHRPVKFREIKDVMEEPPSQGVIWFLCEPAIIHIVSRELGGAVDLLNIARESGFKRVGIQSCKRERILVEICSTERIDAPLVHEGRILVDEGYIRYLVNVANDKYVRGQDKLRRLDEHIRNKL